MEKRPCALPGVGHPASHVADLSGLSDVEALATAVAARHTTLAVQINNAGGFLACETFTPAGRDVRFAGNTITPCLLTQRLLPLLGASGRVVNLSPAAQPVYLGRLAGRARLADLAEYTRSKLLTLSPEVKAPSSLRSIPGRRLAARG